MSGQKIIGGLQEVLDGKVGRITEVFVTPPSPEEVVAKAIAGFRAHTPVINRDTRKTAAAVTRALRDAGWRILR